ncbi:hypothetical protein BCR33DRAFT_721444 [Rhizoclosmatium globosum]|uniref:G-protein coupled receptors family 1 profile domain-containing protein n=1 Tax=Rhizoclosmatium globosum TaxID=329046 RepID=A0A1Y2BRM4_9FUNG|nr:hypothetical protein BCR33DRAFT_721444 [Rhizoclosmatium globosum]|eukprot:ORY37401.1 hypothetical protein BCR33DRAFT_721444 [Rhizoclosmatium globosum]
MRAVWIFASVLAATCARASIGQGSTGSDGSGEGSEIVLLVGGSSSSSSGLVSVSVDTPPLPPALVYPLHPALRRDPTPATATGTTAKATGTSAAARATATGTSSTSSQSQQSQSQSTQGNRTVSAWPNYAAVGLASVGFFFNVALIAALAAFRMGIPILRRQSKDSLNPDLVTKSPEDAQRVLNGSLLNQAIFNITVICILEAILILISNLFYITGSTQKLVGGPNAHKDPLPDSEITIRYVSVIVGYFLACALFCVNLVLALERHSVIRNARSLSKTVLVFVYAFTLLAFSLFVAAFYLANKNSCASTGGFNMRFGRPFAMPGPNVPTIKALFLAGLCYFPIVTLVILIIYADSYRLVAILVQENYDMQMEGGSISDQDQDDSLSSNTTKQKRNVLIRCVIMSVGVLLFYAPTIVLIFIDRLNQAAAPPAAFTVSANATVPANVTTAVLSTGVIANCSAAASASDPSDSWQYAVTTILPALDLFWTPLLILWVQAQHRGVFIKYFVGLWRRLTRQA